MTLLDWLMDMPGLTVIAVDATASDELVITVWTGKRVFLEYVVCRTTWDFRQAEAWSSPVALANREAATDAYMDRERAKESV